MTTRKLSTSAAVPPMATGTSCLASVLAVLPMRLPRLFPPPYHGLIDAVSRLEWFVVRRLHLFFFFNNSLIFRRDQGICDVWILTEEPQNQRSVCNYAHVAPARRPERLLSLDDNAWSHTHHTRTHTHTQRSLRIPNCCSRKLLSLRTVHRLVGVELRGDATTLTKRDKGEKKEL